MAKDKLLQVRLPDELKEEAQTKADKTGESLSLVVRVLLRKWVKENVD